MLAIAAYVELGLCWILWSLAFVRPQKRAAGQKKAVRAPSSLWGILLVTLGFACIWAFVRPANFEKSLASLIASMILGPPSVALAWMAARHLDKQWRFEAALSEDHNLITTGPVPMGAQSDLRVNVGDVAGDRICENLVAAAGSRSGFLPDWNRDSRARRGAVAGRTIRRRIQAV